MAGMYRNFLEMSYEELEEKNLELKEARKARIDIGKLAQHPFTHRFRFDFGELEDESRDDVVLLGLGLRVEEEERLREVIGKGLRADAHLLA